MNAQKVMSAANLEANRMGSDQIGTEHLLLGLVREGKGTAAAILKALRVDLDEVANEIERRTPKYAARQTSKRAPALETKAVLEAASTEADRLGPPAAGTEHLLVALMRISQCSAAKTLQEHGVTDGAVSQEIDKRRQDGSGGGRE